MHPQCAKVRLVDRCVQCNPCYGEPNQAFEIYQEQKRTGKPLKKVEQAYIERHRPR